MIIIWHLSIIITRWKYCINFWRKKKTNNDWSYMIWYMIRYLINQILFFLLFFLTWRSLDFHLFTFMISFHSFKMYFVSDEFIPFLPVILKEFLLRSFKNLIFEYINKLRNQILIWYILWVMRFSTIFFLQRLAQIRRLNCLDN